MAKRPQSLHGARLAARRLSPRALAPARRPLAAHLAGKEDWNLAGAPRDGHVGPGEHVDL